MIQIISDSRWFIKVGLVVCITLVVVCLWSYLAGGVFLIAFKRNFNEATPLTLYKYWYYYGATKQVHNWLIISSSVSLVLLLSPLFFFFSPAKKSLFGDARFAKNSEIKKAGLLDGKGIIVGKKGNKYLQFHGSQHVLIAAPTRSGKGVGVVIPNLLYWPESVVVLDIKQENWDITSGYRKKYGQECYLFNPAAVDYRTHRYNPLAYISDNPHFRIDDIQKIANMLFPDQAGVDIIWTATPRSLFLGIVLYLIETPHKIITLGQVLRETLVNDDGSAYFKAVIEARALGEKISGSTDEEAEAIAAAHLKEVMGDKGKADEKHSMTAEMAVWYQLKKSYKNRIDGEGKSSALIKKLSELKIEKELIEIGKALTPSCVRALNSYTSISSDKTRAGVMTSFRSRLELWMNPLVDAATSENDFDLRDVRKKKMSIYLGVTPDNLERMAPLLNLFFQQLIDLNTRELPNQNKDITHTCLLLMDEFTSIGKIGILSKGISYIAGYWLRMMPIIQSPSQLVEVYGRDAAQTFQTNHALNIIFPPKASETQAAKDISDWLGYQTVKGRSESRGKEMFSKRSKSESLSDQRRALMLPQEITGLGQKKELVIMENAPPILAKKILFFKDKVFMDRLKSVSSDLGAVKSLPTQNQLNLAIEKKQLGADVPELDLIAHDARLSQEKVLTVPQNKDGEETIINKRPVLPEDAPKLDLLRFSMDFVVEKPEGTFNAAKAIVFADDMNVGIISKE